MAFEVAAQVTVNDPTAAAANAAAISAAFAAAPRVYLPDGQIVYSQQVSPPDSAKKLFGNATLILAGTPPGNGSGLISIGGTTGFVLEDVVAQVDTGQFPTIGGVILGNAVGTEIRRVSASGAYGFGSVPGPTDTLFDHCAVTGYTLQGFNLTGCTGLRVRDCSVGGGATGSQSAFGISSSAGVWVSGCKAVNSKRFGFGLAAVNNFHVDRNISLDSVVEGFNATSCTNGTVSDNVLLWPTRNPVTTTDFGASFWAQGAQCSLISFTGNVIDAPAKACLAIAGDQASVQRIAATGNLFTSPCSIGHSVDFPDFSPCMVIYGGGAVDNQVGNNTIRDLVGFMQYVAIEWATQNGTPAQNELGPNYGALAPGVQQNRVIGNLSKGFST